MNLLDFYIPEWFFVILNLVVLTLVLRKLLWKPVTGLLDARREKIARSLQDAEEAARRVGEMEIRRGQQEDQMEQFTRDKMKEARERAGREYDRIIADAGKKAAVIIAGAEARAKQEQERMLHESRERMMDIVLAVTAALIEQKMDSEANRTLIKAILEKEGVA
jgi:F-type H+-transporting ATPase subunit b